MSVEKVDTIIVGGGQAGLAMSEHLGRRGVAHLVLERNRIAERWRSERWDSLVANGPAWHDRFPGMTFDGIEPGSFATKEKIVEYFEAYAKQIAAPIRTGVDVISIRQKAHGAGFLVETSEGNYEATNVVAATGPFQRPIIPTVVPAESNILQMHSNHYRNPGQLPDGAVLVIGAGSSGAQIADEILRSGRRVYLAVGPHQRPPRSYRGKDFCWWLGVLGHWEAKTRDPSMEHVTIAVSGARGGHTVDFREFASRGMTLVGKADFFRDGVMHFEPDLADNIAQGDANYLSVLDEADAYAARNKLDLPEEPEARNIGPDPQCVTDPILQLDLAKAGVTSIIWATGYALDFSWLKVDAFDDKGRPVHERGVASVPGLYFLGLAWLSRRASPFIWGVWHDADYLGDHIAGRAGNIAGADKIASSAAR
ncbi:NAD(P)/FAD-dependent oxidoreductase [Neorhizobium galegae]|uniref:flavin-containing monooxygenase n=1 Tax=Neorhizobium galegae TaxID=399 RepID=UPI0006281E3C|nr:NAD(P)/FAD-dependent oxidoreductase [Neorhizobium galegae]MCQ1768379.1 NAD(P)/FAD-dependent oxidoreductase [Neorhizobium galegae]MCQ1847351.1 NAD(P)/FAD-dependent oxidoreductase [Neorhizobium galegae]